MTESFGVDNLRKTFVDSFDVEYVATKARMMLIMEKEEESPLARLFIMIGPSSHSSSPRFCNHLQTLRLVCFLTTSSVSFCNQFEVQSRRIWFQKLHWRIAIGALQRRSAITVVLNSMQVTARV